MNDLTLEICAFSLDACKKAEKAGANRIELCASPEEGGTTPSYSLIKKACSCLSIPIVPIIRPRGGDFFYNEEEFEMMQEDIKIAKKLGCYGVALGVLKQNNTIDIKRTKQLVELAYPMPVTFIRAFDLTPDPIQALEDIISTGCKRILTSGQQLRADEDIPLLKKLIEMAKDKISIMPGSGINAESLNLLTSKIKPKEYHASARVFDRDTRLLNFGFGSAVSCNLETIKQMRDILDNLTIL